MHCRFGVSSANNCQFAGHDDSVTGAEYAIGGVVVGAIASGSVQATLAQSERRRTARAAARILLIELHGAESSIKDLRQLRDWHDMITNWSGYEVAWTAHREQLALALNTIDFTRVSTAFGCLATLARARARDQYQDENDPDAHGKRAFDPSDETLARYEKAVDKARLVTLSASFRWWELFQRRRALGTPTVGAVELNAADIRARQVEEDD